MKPTWKTCLRISGCAFLLYLCIHFLPNFTGFLRTVFGAAMPLLLGAVIAYIINIPMRAFERHYFPKHADKPLVRKTRRPVCFVLALLAVVLVVALIFSLIIPELIQCFRVIIDVVPDAIEGTVNWLSKQEWIPDDIFDSVRSIDWEARLEQILKTFLTGLGSAVNIVTSAVTSLFSVLANALIGVIFAVYLLFGQETLSRQSVRLMKHYLPEKMTRRICYVAGILNDSFHKFIVGQCLEAVILGGLCTAGMALLRLPYATMIGALIAFTALIPVAGAYIGAAVGALMILTVSPVKALIFLVFLVLLQQFEGNVIYPKVVGSSIGLPGIFVLGAITLGGGLMGVAGMLLGVPLCAAVYRILQNDMKARDGLPHTSEKQDSLTDAIVEAVTEPIPALSSVPAVPAAEAEAKKKPSASKSKKKKKK